MDGTAIADEFAGCTIEDIALAVAYGEPGSEDQGFALEALRRRLPAGIGHNSPPLHEVLEEELEPFRRRRDELIKTADTAAIVDHDTAANVLDLVQLCRAYETEIDTRRKTLIKPHRDAEKLINDSHNRLRLDVQVARQGMTGTGGLRALLTDWDDKQKAQVAVAKQKAEAEAKAKEIAAQAAREPLERMAPGGRGAVSAQLAAMAATDQADRARAEVDAIQPMPIRAHLGQVSRKREIRFEIVDWLTFAAWADAQPTLQNSFHAALAALCGGHLRALGVDAVAAGVAIPGVTASVTQGEAIIRR